MTKRGHASCTEALRPQGAPQREQGSDVETCLSGLPAGRGVLWLPQGRTEECWPARRRACLIWTGRSHMPVRVSCPFFQADRKDDDLPGWNHSSMEKACMPPRPVLILKVPSCAASGAVTPL